MHLLAAELVAALYSLTCKPWDSPAPGALLPSHPAELPHTTLEALPAVENRRNFLISVEQGFSMQLRKPPHDPSAPFGEVDSAAVLLGHISAFLTPFHQLRLPNS